MESFSLNIIIGNLISFASFLAGLKSSHAQTMKETLFFNSIQSVLAGLTCLVLGAWSGILLEIIAVPRNMIVAKNRFTDFRKIIFIIIITGVTLWIVLEKTIRTGTFAWIELVPLIPTIPYTWLIDEYEDMGLKVLNLATTPFWVLYEILNQNYVSVASEAVTSLFNALSALNIWKDKRFY